MLVRGVPEEGWGKRVGRGDGDELDGIADLGDFQYPFVRSDGSPLWVEWC